MRFLREYSNVANVTHFCDCCNKYIMPGEQYHGIVYVTSKNQILVSKQHENPACDFPDPEKELGLRKIINTKTIKLNAKKVLEKVA